MGNSERPESAETGSSKELPLIVMKFGGAALATTNRIGIAAERILQTAGSNRVVVVVSAMGEQTDALLELTEKFQTNQLTNGGEVDTVLAAGEQIAAGLMTLALAQRGAQAQSFLAHQLPIVTDSCFGDGRILRIEVDRLAKTLRRGVIPVIAGFQGIDHQQRLVTLGRGGSDTSAVAIAAALQAEICEFYKDVDGIYSADPRMSPNAYRFTKLDYRQMEELAEREPQILHRKAVRLARHYDVRLHIRSAFSEAVGTIVEHVNVTNPMQEVSA